jgi:hypothetical protein
VPPKNKNKKYKNKNPDVVACNPGYLGDQDRRVKAPGQPRQKVSKSIKKQVDT